MPITVPARPNSIGMATLDALIAMIRRRNGLAVPVLAA